MVSEPTRGTALCDVTEQGQSTATTRHRILHAFLPLLLPVTMFASCTECLETPT